MMVILNARWRERTLGGPTAMAHSRYSRRILRPCPFDTGHFPPRPERVRIRQSHKCTRLVRRPTGRGLIRRNNPRRRYRPCSRPIQLTSPKNRKHHRPSSHRGTVQHQQQEEGAGAGTQGRTVRKWREKTCTRYCSTEIPTLRLTHPDTQSLRGCGAEILRFDHTLPPATSSLLLRMLKLKCLPNLQLICPSPLSTGSWFSIWSVQVKFNVGGLLQASPQKVGLFVQGDALYASLQSVIVQGRCGSEEMTTEWILG